ncbi:MAG: hypothetical protein ABIL68_02060 [bacterium]
MFYLAWQTLFWLIVAFLFGLFIGWLIWHRRVDAETSEFHMQIQNLKDELEACNDNLKICKKESEKSGKEKPAPRLPSSIPTARSEEADDLKDIWGVGPFLEGKLNAFGIYTFRQVASLNNENIKELGMTFGSFQGRVVRDQWVEQAKKLHETKYGEKL